jgi:hypothetical protein
MQLSSLAFACSALIVVAACSGKTENASTGNGNGQDGHSTQSDGTGAASSCSDQTKAGGDAVRAAVETAAMDLSCASDDECVFASNDSVCSAGCGVLLNAKGAASLASAIDQVDHGVCANFAADGCHSFPLPCFAPIQAACVAGMCANFPPAKWTKFVIDQHASQTGGFGIPAACTAGETGGCKLWSLTPDGKVAVTVDGVEHDATLSTTDLAAVDATLRSMSFRQSNRVGFDCAKPPAGNDTVIAFDVSRGSGESGYDVTGCALEPAGANDAAHLYAVLKAY